MSPNKLQRCRLKVAVTQLSLSESDRGQGDDDVLPRASRGATSLEWADQPDPAFPEEDIFVGNLSFADKPGLLEVSEDEEAILPFGIPQAQH